MDIEPTAEKEAAKFSMLVVDDEFLSLTLVQERLKYSPLAPQISLIETASDGQQALDKLKENKGKFNVVITDGRMPNKDGLDLAREIKESGEDIVVGLITGGIRDLNLDNPNARERIQKDYGISAVLKKPYKKEQFLEFVGKIRDARELKNQPKSV